MVTRVLLRSGIRGEHWHVSSLGGIVLCISLWIRAKTVDQELRGNAERRALFVGLWPATLWLIGDAVERAERDAADRSRRSAQPRGGITRRMRSSRGSWRSP